MILEYRISVEGIEGVLEGPPYWDNDRPWRDQGLDDHAFGPAWSVNWSTVKAWMTAADKKGMTARRFKVWNATGGDLREERHLVGVVDYDATARSNFFGVVRDINKLIAEHESGTKFRERDESGGGNAA